MTVSNEPEISKEIRTLLTKGIAGQRGKSKALGMVIRFIRSVFPGFSISERILLQFKLMTRVKWMNQRDNVSRRRESIGGTGYIEASHAGNIVIVARGIVICTRNSTGSTKGGQPSLGGQPTETIS
jgi:hypothetical protein